MRMGNILYDGMTGWGGSMLPYNTRQDERCVQFSLLIARSLPFLLRRLQQPTSLTLWIYPHYFLIALLFSFRRCRSTLLHFFCLVEMDRWKSASRNECHLSQPRADLSQSSWVRVRVVLPFSLPRRPPSCSFPLLFFSDCDHLHYLSGVRSAYQIGSQLLFQV